MADFAESQRLPADDRTPANPRRGAPSHLYMAFLSYARADEEIAAWLHDELEMFRVPSRLVGKLTELGPVPRRLTPIFRDRHELAAGRELKDEIEDALAGSRFLIVLCSRACARSEWVNKEIDCFKRLNPDRPVLAAIADGEPFASLVPGKEEDECFPPALRVKYNKRGLPTRQRAEPIAADLREGQDGRKLGLLKIIAGMLGVELDDLAQRETHRRQRRMALVTAASLAGMIATSGLAVAAIEARDEARDQRREAEGLIEFMLVDLRKKLEPIGRLDALDAVGSRALAYYEHQDRSGVTDAGLAQRARALTLMGEIASARGDLDGALRRYREAMATTRELMQRRPEDPQRIFDHAQNVFYVGDVARSRGLHPQAEAAMREYKRLADKLIRLDPRNPKWQMEGIYADGNLGIMLMEDGRYAQAARIFETSLVNRERLAASASDNDEYRNALIEGLAWLGDAREKEGRLEEGLTQRERQIALLQPLIRDPHGDTDYRRQALVAYRAAGRLNAILGNVARGIQQLETALRIGQALAAAEPANAEWSAMTTGARFELAKLQLAQSRTGGTSALIRSGCEATRALMAKDPTVVGWRLELRSTCLELNAREALANGDLNQARTITDQMAEVASSELARGPSSDAQLALANAELLGGLVRRIGRDRTAAGSFRRAAAAWPKDVPDRPVLIARKVLILEGLGRRADSRALAARLDRINYRDPTYLHDRALMSA